MPENQELSATLAVLTGGIAELRRDSERNSEEVKQLRTESKAEYKELREAMTELAVMHKEAIAEQREANAEQRGYNREFAVLREEIYGKEFGILTRLSKQETESSNDKLRWGVLVSITLVVLGGIGGLWSTVVKPTQDAAKIIADAQASNDEVIKKLDTNNDNLKNIFELMIQNYGAQDEANN